MTTRSRTTLRDLEGVGLGLRWAFLDEVAEGEIPASIPFFELSPENYMGRGGYFPEALEKVADRSPLLTHGLMMNLGSSDPLDRRYFAGLRAFLDELGVAEHSDHLCWTGAEGRTLHDLLPLPTDRATIAHVVDRIRRAQDLLGRPLAVENISYYMLPGQSLPEHEWMAEVLERADCQLLLDVNNVWVNARNHGFDPHVVLRTLPLDRVAHLHVAGGERLSAYDDLVIDTHGTDVDERVTALMVWVLERTGPLPVVYERDHDIPPLAELAAQVEALSGHYDAAIGRWHRARSGEPIDTPAATLRSPSTPKPAPEAGSEAGSKARSGARSGATSGAASAQLAALERHFVQAVLAPALPEAGSLPPRGLALYRRLVRRGLAAPLRRFLPRTEARLGSAQFQGWVDAWLGTVGPRSQFLRELPHEFGAWVTPKWREDPAVASYLVDLARHELLEMEVEAAPRSWEPRPEGDPEAGPDAGRDAGADTLRRDPVTPSLDQPLRFAPAARLASYERRVHELPAALEDRSVPAPGPVSLLAYRDVAHEVRYLELSPLGAALVGLLMGGAPLGAAVAQAAETAGEVLDDDLLVRVARLLADLGDRGALLGPASATASS